MSYRHLSVVLYFIGLLLGTCYASGGNGTNDGVKLADWHAEEFEHYGSVILSLLFITLFKMYYPKIPYIPQYIPQSLLLIVIGVIFGAILNAVTATNLDKTFWKMSPSMFFNYLLPPIVLDASYSLYNRTFLDYLGSILIYAVFGTVLNFFIIGPLMYGLNVAGAMGSGAEAYSLKSYFLFSSLIVAVDPVAVLAIFQDIGVEPSLYYMVFGESLFNDAVTVVLYRIMSSLVGVDQIEGSQIGLGLVSFLTISLGGLIIGVLIGIISSFFTRFTGHFGCFLTVMMAYFSYILGDCVGWSGIIAMIGCGLVQADYAFHNISPGSLTSIHVVIKEISEVSEAFIFFLIGVQLFSAEIAWDTGFCLWGIVVSLLARTTVTLGLTFLINKINLNNIKITLKQQAILIYGGLRGAVALSLALLVEYQDLGKNGVHVRKVIVTATLFIILFTVGFMGFTMKPLVKFFKIKLAGKEELSIFSDLNGNILDHVLAGIETIIGANGRNSTRVFFTRIDDKYIRRFLQRNPETHDERIVRTYENIALKLHYASIKPTKSSAYLKGLPETIRQKHLNESGDSITHLPSLTANTSDPRLLDYFSNAHGNDSSSNINGQSSESLDTLHESRVKFTDTTKLDDDEHFVNPNWRRRSSAFMGNRNDEFQNEYLSVLKSKAKASRFLTHRRKTTRPRLYREEDESDREKYIDAQTAANTARNRFNTQPDHADRPTISSNSNIPPRDYPINSPQSSTTRFHIGDDE